MFASAIGGLTFCLTLAASWQSGVCGSVAFSAGVSAQQWQIFERGVIVPYNRVYTNQGLGYNNRTGVFTAPKGGMYVFHFHALAAFNTEVILQLYHNGNQLITAYANTPGAHSHGGNSIVLKLQKNDKAYVKTARQSNLQCTPNEVHATFTGYLI